MIDLSVKIAHTAAFVVWVLLFFAAISDSEDASIILGGPLVGAAVVWIATYLGCSVVLMWVPA